MKKLLFGLVLYSGIVQGQLIRYPSDFPAFKGVWVYDMYVDVSKQAVGSTVRMEVSLSTSIANSDTCYLYITSVNEDTINQVVRIVKIAVSEMEFLRQHELVQGGLLYNQYRFYVTVPDRLSTIVDFLRVWSWRKSPSSNATNFSGYSSSITLLIPTGLENQFLNESNRKVVAIYDMQGRRIEDYETGTVFIAVYSDGSKKKVIALNKH